MNKQMIDTLFFDFDGVLTFNERGSTTTIEYLHQNNPEIPLDTIRDAYYMYHPLLISGQKTHEEIWPDFCKSIGKNIDFKILNEAFLATPMNPEMIALAKQLAKKYQLGIITTNAKERMETLIKEYDLADIFDPIVISAMVGSSKDQADIFEVALVQSGKKAIECVFIDNQEKNLIAPSKLGFETIHFDPVKNDIQKLKESLYKLGFSF